MNMQFVPLWASFSILCFQLSLSMASPTQGNTLLRPHAEVQPSSDTRSTNAKTLAERMNQPPANRQDIQLEVLGPNGPRPSGGLPMYPRPNLPIRTSSGRRRYRSDPWQPGIDRNVWQFYADLTARLNMRVFGAPDLLWTRVENGVELFRTHYAHRVVLPLDGPHRIVYDVRCGDGARRDHLEQILNWAILSNGRTDRTYWGLVEVDPNGREITPW